MGCSKQCSTKLYVPHLPSTEGSEGGIVPAMHQINFKWPNTKDAKEEADKQAKFLNDVKDLSDILSNGVDKSSHISSPSEMYDPIITHQQIFTKLLDRKSLQDINSQRLANVSNTFQEAFSSKTSTLKKKKKSQFLTEMKVDKTDVILRAITRHPSRTPSINSAPLSKWQSMGKGIIPLRI
eukprot:scaffold200363_cov50-Attheya_sp.AAC.1